jgi:hypothetical protein
MRERLFFGIEFGEDAVGFLFVAVFPCIVYHYQHFCVPGVNYPFQGGYHGKGQELEEIFAEYERAQEEYRGGDHPCIFAQVVPDLALYASGVRGRDDGVGLKRQGSAVFAFGEMFFNGGAFLLREEAAYVFGQCFFGGADPVHFPPCSLGAGFGFFGSRHEAGPVKVLLL